MKFVAENLWSEDEGAPYLLRDTRLEMAKDGTTTLSGEMDHFSPLLDVESFYGWTASFSAPAQAWVGEPFVGAIRLVSSEGSSAAGGTYGGSSATRIKSLSPASGERVAISDAWGSISSSSARRRGRGCSM